MNVLNYVRRRASAPKSSFILLYSLHIHLSFNNQVTTQAIKTGNQVTLNVPIRNHSLHGWDEIPDPSNLIVCISLDVIGKCQRITWILIILPSTIGRTTLVSPFILSDTFSIRIIPSQRRVNKAWTTINSTCHI